MNKNAEPSMMGSISERHQRIVLTIVVLGTLMGALDSTIVLLAFPVINDSLKSNFITTIWIILAYLLVIAVTTTQMGRIGDIYGRGKIFNIGFVVFTVGSLFCGLSPHIFLLIAFRTFQAVGGAIMQANSGAIIADIFPREVRGRAYGYNSLGFTSGAMLGIVLGGIITTFVGWQYIFFLNIPIGIIAVTVGVKYIKDTRKNPQKIDLSGMILLAVAFILLSLGLIDFTTQGLAPINIAATVLGVALTAVFIWYDRKLKNPMIDFNALKNRTLRNSILSAFFVSLGYFSVVFLVIMYLQGIRALSPLNASLLLIPGYVAGSFLGPAMGRLSDKYGSREISTLGVVFLGFAIVTYLTLGVNSSLYIVLLGSAISGFGTSMFFPANNSAVMANAKAESYGSISGLLRTLQNIGILGSFVLAISIAAASIPREAAFEVFIGTTNLAGGVSGDFIAGIDHAFYVSILILAIAGVLSLIRGKDLKKSPT
ncbi:MAG: MFS transporter [Candidatus Bathyarchaeota archaeon]|nr:MFS transporter [Candidatus Bathyarchaeota archaeon]